MVAAAAEKLEADSIFSFDNWYPIFFPVQSGPNCVLVLSVVEGVEPVEVDSNEWNSLSAEAKNKDKIIEWINRLLDDIR